MHLTAEDADDVVVTPAALGLSLPPETARHDRCLMAWPPTRSLALWGDERRLDQARDAWAASAHAIARFEPVTMIVDPEDRALARTRLGSEVEIAAVPIDDAWSRDSGPIILTDARGERTAVDFRFNAWGRKHPCWERDDGLPAAIADRWGLPCLHAPFVLEGGAIVGNGAGLLVVTERCLLNPNRNPTMSKMDIELALREWLGVDDVLWIPDGLADDAETDGHADNVVAFARPDVALVQSTTDTHDPDYRNAVEIRARLEDAGIDVVMLDVLPATEAFGRRVEVPYLNHYVANGGVIVPVAGHRADPEMLDRIGACYPGRDIVGVPGEVIAFGGGGVHCITQPVPAAP